MKYNSVWIYIASFSFRDRASVRVIHVIQLYRADRIMHHDRVNWACCPILYRRPLLILSSP